LSVGAHLAQGTFFGISAAMRDDGHRVRNSASVTVGVKLSSRVHRAVQFVGDKRLQWVEVGGSCERCSRVDCSERAAKPIHVNYTKALSVLQEFHR
jgi:predicted transcriptional regulator